MAPMDTEGHNNAQGQESELDRTILRPQVPELMPHEAQYQPLPAYAQRSEQVRGSRLRTRHGSKARHGCLAALLWPLALIIAVLCVARMLPLGMSSGRLIPEAVSVIPWLIVPSAVICLLAALWRRGLLAALSGICLALLLWWHAGYFLAAGSLSGQARAASSAGTAPSSADGVMRIMTLNVANGGADAGELAAYVADNGIELLALQEVTWTFLDELAQAGLFDVLPHYVQSEASYSDNGGLNCLFSMAPLYDASSNLLPTELSAMCAGTVDVGGRYLRFVSCHPSSPHLGGEGLWTSGLSTIGSLSDYDHAYVIMGDFNSTWNHARFRDLLGKSFVDASQQAGEGFHMTWPSDFSTYAEKSRIDFGSLPKALEGAVPPLIEIDHIVYAADAGIFVGDLRTTHIAGTDHLALIGTLELQ